MGACILGVVDPSSASGSPLRIRLSASSFKAMRWCTCGPKDMTGRTKHGLQKPRKPMTLGDAKDQKLPGSKMIKSYLDQISEPGPCVSTEIGSPAKNGHISSNKFLAWTSSWNTLGTKTWKRSTEHRNPRKQLFDCNILFQVTWLRSRNKQKPMFKNMCLYIYIYGCFHKWWYPTTIGFPAKNDHFGVFLGYHYFRKHPYINLKIKYILYNIIYIHLPIPFTKHEIISVVTVAEWGSIPTYTYYLGYALLD